MAKKRRMTGPKVTAWNIHDHDHQLIFKTDVQWVHLERMSSGKMEDKLYLVEYYKERLRGDNPFLALSGAKEFLEKKFAEVVEAIAKEQKKATG